MVTSFESVIKPYDYQVPVVDAVEKALEIRDEALYVMAMGLGKTMVSAFVAKPRLLRGQRGLYLCHENYILEHVEQDYKLVIGDSIKYKTFYGSEGTGKKDWTADSADMLFASFQSLNNWHEQWFLAFDRDHFDFIVIDESHHGPAPTYKEVIDYFIAKKIFMTATPDRNDLKDLREMSGPEVYTISLETGIANGWLASVEYHILSDGINNAKLKKICKDVLEHGKRVSIKQLNETIFIHERDKSESQIIEEYTKIKEYAGDRKGLLFCERTIHADNLAPHFEKSGVMHSKKSWKENDRVFKAFEKDELQWVASVNKFNEGKHVPGVELIAMLRGTDSPIIFWQQLGRALALNGNLKKKVIILDFVANVERLIMIRDMMLRIQEIQAEPVVGPVKPPIDTNVFNVSGEGFEFIFSDEIVDVMKVIEALRKGYYQTCEEASKAAIALGIKTRTEYKSLYKKDLRLPWAPDVIYGVDFPGYPVFLGIEDDMFQPTMEIALAELKAKGITDHWSLVQCKVGDLYGYEFGRFGKATALMGFVLGKGVTMSFDSMLELSSKLGWMPSEEARNARYKQELAKHKIVDYWTLVTKKSSHFSKLKFGKFGAAGHFCFFVFGLYLRDMGLTSNKVELLEKLAKKIGWEMTEENKKEKFKEELAKQKITDYWSLIGFTLTKFQKTEWGIFGQGKAFLGFFFDEFKDDRSLSEGTLYRIAELLKWTPTEEEKNKRYKEEFAKHGIVDYPTLLENPYPSSIRKADFGQFGKGFSFCSLVLNKTADQFSATQIIDELATKFGWLPDEKGRAEQEELKKAEYRTEFAKHGIIDYWSLILGSSRIVKLKFGKFGGSVGFISTILGKKPDSISKEVLEEVVKKLGWDQTEEQKIVRYKEELAKQKITDYWSLVAKQQVGLVPLKFGKFGGGTLFFKIVMNKTLKNDASLDELAEKLGWSITEDQRIEKYREALIKNGIKDYWDILVIGIDDFRTLDFGFFGKGTAFCCRVLGKNLASISTKQRVEVAEKIGWVPTEEEKIRKYKEELAKHGISNRKDLDSIRTDHFTSLDFGVFGKARLFINYVFGNIIGVGSHITRKIMDDLAEKIGFTDK